MLFIHFPFFPSVRFTSINTPPNPLQSLTVEKKKEEKSLHFLDPESIAALQISPFQLQPSYKTLIQSKGRRDYIMCDLL